MAATGFALSHLFATDLPAPAPRWTGFPKYNFIGGHNDPERVPAAELAAAAAAALRRDGADLALFNPHGPQGFRPIREFVVAKVKVRGIACSPEDVLITSGSGQGLDLVNRVMLNRGDWVILEEFTYGGALTKLQRLGVNVVGAPLDDDGLVIEALDRIVSDLKAKGTPPKFIYTIPTVQNPTGSILPVERRQALLALARKHGVAIFEDECYADLTWNPEAPAAIYAMDPSRVIHVGSFSKTLSPALRLGYVIADWTVMSRLVGLKRELDSGTGALEQMVEALEREFGTAVEKMWRPKGGIFLWIKLPDRIDVTKLVAPAAAQGLVFNPGPEWSCNAATSKSHMRLCFALPSKEAIREGIATLARVCYEETGIPEQSANIRRTSVAD